MIISRLGLAGQVLEPGSIIACLELVFPIHHFEKFLSSVDSVLERYNAILSGDEMNGDLFESSEPSGEEFGCVDGGREEDKVHGGG